jgi:amino acid transporter
MDSDNSDTSDDHSNFQHIQSTSPEQQSKYERLKHIIVGAPRNIHDPSVFHRISLVAFLAWVGLGADGLSSSSYGPDEAFRAIGSHAYLAVGLAVATALTVFIISYAYSRIIEHFPYGGGGYVVASKLLGPKYGVISGSALLVDYVLTIAVSIASALDQIFSVLPYEYSSYKMLAVCLVICMLMVLNLRGIKESVTVLMPIFLVFLLTHAILIVGGIGSHLFEAQRVVSEVNTGFQIDYKAIGLMGIFAIFVRGYSMGAGTYTGIEAVSNGIQVMREPKVETAKRTMMYMAISLALTAGGIFLCYLFFKVTPEGGKTMNAVLLERFAGSWNLGSIHVGYIFVVITLGAEAALLFVAAQTGFIDGPRIMANMSIDSWLPHRFSSLSDRLTMQNGVVLISVAAILTLFLTGGHTSTLVLMYSINVFLTFSLSEMGMVRYWIQNRTRYPKWWRHIFIHAIGLVLCLSILIVNLIEKFGEGGWVTLVITTVLIGFCFLIKRYYRNVRSHLARLDEILQDLPGLDEATPRPLNPKLPTAVLLVGNYGGLGIHSFLSIHRLFPNHFKNFIFMSVSVVDAGTLKGVDEIEKGREETVHSLRRYVALAQQFGYAADYRSETGTEVLEVAEKICIEISHEYPRAIFYTGKLVFQKEQWYQRFLHNETANQLQRRLQFAGINTMVLPVRVFDPALTKSA